MREVQSPSEFLNEPVINVGVALVCHFRDQIEISQQEPLTPSRSRESPQLLDESQLLLLTLWTIDTSDSPVDVIVEHGDSSGDGARCCLTVRQSEEPVRRGQNHYVNMHGSGA